MRHLFSLRRVTLARVFCAAFFAASACAIAFAPSAAIARPAPDSFADLAARLLPTVVNIASEQTLRGGNAGAEAALPDLPPGSPLQDLFKDFMSRNRAAPKHVTSLGSGFIIDPTGLIVTNNHVIEDADHITVTLNDGRSLPAKLIGRDEKTDLALLKVYASTALPFAKFGDSDHARIGDWVIAIGNPFGLGSTVTAGIVSARNRDINQGQYDDFIQTDAPINRGNSGGPLFDMDGNVIGVNSAIYSPSGGSVGIGFSIPSDMVRQVIDQLRHFGTVRRGYIGVRIQEVSPEIAESLGLHGTAGALVADVSAGGPAARAGLHNGDVVLSYDGRPISDSRVLTRLVAETPAGKSVPLDVLRGGKHLALHITPAMQRDDKSARLPVPVQSGDARHARLGLTLAAIDNGTRGRFHLPKDAHGAVITAVDPDSEAGEKGFRAGDVIVEVQNQPVRNPQDVALRIDAEKKAGKKVVLMLVNRGGTLSFVGVRL